MNLESLKKDTKYHWTNHVIRKMSFYGLSPDRVKRVIRSPKRVEEGIAENTIGVMQPSTNIKKPTEVWVMYQKRTSNKKQIKNNKESGSENKSLVNGHKLSVNNNFTGHKIIVISAWRYPGVSPVGKRISIPQDILEELKADGLIEK